MSKRALIAVAVAVLLAPWPFPPSPAAAFDLKGPADAVEHLLARVRALAKPAPAQNGNGVEANGSAQQAGRSGNPASPAAAAARKPAAGQKPAPGLKPPAGQMPAAEQMPGTQNPEAEPAGEYSSANPRAPEDRAAGEEAAPDSAENAMLEQILLSPTPYHYQGEGRRDPFVSLVVESSAADKAEEHSDQLHVRGILWGENDRFALVENDAGTSYILRQGDRCGRFSVVHIQYDGIVIYSTQYGVGKTETLKLTDEKGSQNAPRPH